MLGQKDNNKKTKKVWVPVVNNETRYSKWRPEQAPFLAEELSKASPPKKEILKDEDCKLPPLYTHV